MPSRSKKSRKSTKKSESDARKGKNKRKYAEDKASTLLTKYSNEELYERLWDLKTSGDYEFDQGRQVYYVAQRFERPKERKSILREEWHTMDANVKQVYRELFYRLDREFTKLQADLQEEEDTDDQENIMQDESEAESEPERRTRTQSRKRPRAKITKGESDIEDDEEDDEDEDDNSKLILSPHKPSGKIFGSAADVFLSEKNGMTKNQKKRAWNKMNDEKREPYVAHFAKLTYGLEDYVSPTEYDWTLPSDAELPTRTRHDVWIRDGYNVFMEYHLAKGRSRRECQAQWKPMTSEERAPFANHVWKVIRPQRYPSKVKQELKEQKKKGGKRKLQLALDPTLPTQAPQGGPFQSAEHLFVTVANNMTKAQKRRAWTNMSATRREPYIAHWFKLTFGADAYVPLEGYDWSCEYDELPSKSHKDKWLRNGNGVFMEYHRSRGRTVTRCNEMWRRMTEEERAPYNEFYADVLKPSRYGADETSESESS